MDTFFVDSNYFAIDNLGGEVINPKEVAKASGLGVPVVSYHIIAGSGNLTEFGLVETERGKREGKYVKIITLGRLIAQRRFLEILL